MTSLAKMSRLGVYAVVSTALAAGVVVSAFHQRPNFYSACVYLSQSNLCLMIIINLILLIYTSLMYGLQRLCYGPLRPIEIEQLYEKGWFAVTETCLAMTIFREEVGAWFLVMFVALLTGKVWGWIGDGRVEILEQQPPANPRLFHIRLCVSLTMSAIYDIWLMTYTINTVIQQARPNMMVMFLFEFAVLTTCSFATTTRYGISLIEAKITKQQTIERMAERRREVRDERAEIVRQREAVAAGTATEEEIANTDIDAPLPSEDDVDEMDIEVPGWEAKGQWVLTLDLVTDFVKLLIYVTFFVILLMFYGLPIHIMRDLFMTGRSFTKRLAAFLRYRRATHDMNTKYEDATVEDIAREDTCIICREEMRPWSVTNPPVPAGQQPPARSTGTLNERSRPKKLPCGHILHLGCLKSWLERQQACPTCRRSVVETAQTRPAVPNNGIAPAQGAAQAPGQNGLNVPAAPPRRGNMRMLNIGPLRLGFGQGNLRDIAGGLENQPGQGNQAQGANPRVYGLELGFPRRPVAQAQPQAQAAEHSTTAESIQDQIREMEQTIMGEIRNLQLTQQQLQLVQLLQTELGRLQDMQNGAADPLALPAFQVPRIAQVPVIGQRPMTPTLLPAPASQYMERHTVRPGTVGIPSGSLDLPPGVTIPEGWTLLPMHRMDGPRGSTSPAPSAQSAGPVSSGLAPTATTQAHASFSPTSVPSSSNLTPTPTQSSEIPHQSQASSVDSSDTSIHTPVSTSASTFLSAPGQSSAEITPTGPFSALPHSTSEGGPIIDSTQAADQSPASEPNTTTHQPIDQERLVRESRLRRLDEQNARNAAERQRAQAEEGERSSEPEGKGKAKAVSIEDAEDEDA